MNRFEIEPIRPIDSTFHEVPVAPDIPAGTNAHWGIYREGGGTRRFLPTLHSSQAEARHEEDSHVKVLVTLKLGADIEDFDLQVEREKGNYRIKWLNEFDTYTTIYEAVFAHGVDDGYDHPEENFHNS